MSERKLNFWQRVFGCAWGAHVWGKWKVQPAVATNKITGRQHETAAQVRVCDLCGFTEVRSL